MFVQRSIFSKFTCLLLFVAVLAASTIRAQEPVYAKQGMIVSAEQLATKVGVEILKKGGNAVDAAVGVGFALAVTYPSAGNLGGGGYMVIHLQDGTDVALDYRERAPEKATRNMYLDENGEFNPKLSQDNTSSSGVPGSVAGLLQALKKYGKLSLSEVIQPAIDLAAHGFPVSFAFSNSLKPVREDFKKYPSSAKVFLHGEEVLQPGELFCQPELAATLRLIRDKGADGFYKGEVADKIVAQMTSGGGIISLQDLASYSPVERKVLTGDYRGYTIISMPPSSSGGTTLIESLNVLENFRIDRDEWGSSTYIHKIVEILKHSYADRSEHLADPAYYKVPVSWLTSKQYAKDIFNALTPHAEPSSKIQPGKPPQGKKESEETTHYSVMDKDGNAVSVTTTINSSYGSRVVVAGAGFLLNNEMDDFSAKPGTPNQFGLVGGEANAIAPGKRMLSSMTPTIVLKGGKPFMVIGSPGGSTIITTVLQVIVNTIDFGMNIRQAIDAPRFHHQWLPDHIDYEENAITKDVRENLEKLGYHFGVKRSLGLAEGIIYLEREKLFSGWSDGRGSGLAEGF
jgi:gamma-glutamyltranspeptidase/glutathione hydrolase